MTTDFREEYRPFGDYLSSFSLTIARTTQQLVFLAAAMAVGSTAHACFGTDQSIFFAESTLPIVDGTVAAYIEVMNVPGGPNQPHWEATARVLKVVSGTLSQPTVVLDLPSSSCDHRPRSGQKGIIVGRPTTVDGTTRLTLFSEWNADIRIKAGQARCPLPHPSPFSHVVAYGTQSGEGYSPVSVVGQNRGTDAVKVVVDNGRYPLYVILATASPTIWSFEGDTGRITQVVLASPDKGPYSQAVGVTGISAAKVSYVTCLPLRLSTLEQDSFRRIVERGIGHIDGIAGQLKTYAVQIPSLQPMPLSTSPTAFPGSKPPFSKRDVVSTRELTDYDLPPGNFGLTRLIADGVITLDTDAPEQLKRSGDVYRIVKPLERFPVGLDSFARRTYFILPKGVRPLPQNTTETDCVFLEETGSLMSAHCGFTRLPPSENPKD